jgi:radical SAM superfamily enzyme YgiQ (UPF0313 family)
MKVVLISTYDLGRQPFGLASPAAWLRQAGAEVSCLDLSRGHLDEQVVRAADVVAFFLPMHTATRLALRVAEKIRSLNSSAHFCAYGLYAAVNADHLQAMGFQTVIGGEFEAELERVIRVLMNGGKPPARPAGAIVSLAKQTFIVPDRFGLPGLPQYARLTLPSGEQRVVGYTEASRGCKHLCRHCPIVPVYNGSFRVVQRDVVLEDIRRQVAAGARHITFGDPDFFNGVTHSAQLVRRFHENHPGLTYDVTIKVEHLLKHADYLPLLRDTGCTFVTTAVESVDDRILRILDKGHTRADFNRAVDICRREGVTLVPTFVAFNPWITLEGYKDLLQTIADLGLVEHVAPVQLAIRLLIPHGSRLLELPEVRRIVGEFDREALCYRWEHPDPRVDAIQREVEGIVRNMASGDRPAVFQEVWRCVQRTINCTTSDFTYPADVPQRVTIPVLTEPWYC